MAVAPLNLRFDISQYKIRVKTFEGTILGQKFEKVGAKVGAYAKDATASKNTSRFKLPVYNQGFIKGLFTDLVPQ